MNKALEDKDIVLILQFCLDLLMSIIFDFFQWFVSFSIFRVPIWRR